MGFFRSLAYDVYLGPLPMIAIVGFVTYSVFATTAILVSAKRWSRRLRRVSVKVHRWMAIAALLLATLHLLMGLSVYV